MDQIDIQQDIADEILSVCGQICPDLILAGGAPRDWYLDRPATDLDFYYSAIQAAGNLGQNTKKPFARMAEALGIQLVQKVGKGKVVYLKSAKTVTVTLPAPAFAANQVWVGQPTEIGVVPANTQVTGLQITNPWFDEDAPVNFTLGLEPATFYGEQEYYKTNPDITAVYEGVYKGMKVQFMSCRLPPKQVVAKFPFNLCHIYWTLDDGLCPMEDFVYGVDNQVLVHEFHGYSNRDSYTEKIKKKFEDWVYIDKRKENSFADSGF